MRQGPQYRYRSSLLLSGTPSPPAFLSCVALLLVPSNSSHNLAAGQSIIIHQFFDRLPCKVPSGNGGKHPPRANSESSTVRSFVTHWHVMILWAIHSAICGTTAFPSPLILSTRRGIPCTIRPTSGSTAHQSQSPNTLRPANASSEPRL